VQFVRIRNVKDGDTTALVRPVDLANRFPVRLAGWETRDEPLGANEMVRTAVERTLNYDDYVYRLFRKGETAFGIYVAYWAPGRMPVQKVASHTPDRCWTENGWECEEMRFAETIKTGEISLRPAQWRIFRAPGPNAQKEYVVYWHLVGKRLYDYGNRFNARPDLVKWWRDTVAYAMSGSDAQYFIRITSNRPFQELVDDPAFFTVIGCVADLGLRETP